MESDQNVSVEILFGLPDCAQDPAARSGELIHEHLLSEVERALTQPHCANDDAKASEETARNAR